MSRVGTPSSLSQPHACNSREHSGDHGGRLGAGGAALSLMMSMTMTYKIR